MSQCKKLVVLSAVAVVLIVYIVLRLRSPQLRGEWDANKDLFSGHYILLGYGLPTPGAPEFAQCMGGYGIEIRNIGGDVFANGRDLATGYELSYYQSYNATSSAAIKQKFGPDVFDRCSETARKQFESDREASKLAATFAPVEPKIVGVQQTDVGNQSLMKVSFIVPDVPNYTFDTIKVYGMRFLGTQRSDDRNYPTLHGRWKPNDPVEFSVRVPKEFTDPSEGWNLTLCVGSTQSCYPSSNLLKLVGQKFK